MVLVPAVLYLVWARWGWPGLRGMWGRGVARLVGGVWATAVVLWEGYQRLVVRPSVIWRTTALMMSLHAQRVHLVMVPKVAWAMLLDGGWVSPVLFPLAAVVVVVLSVVWLRELWRVPLFGAAVIAVVGQMAYIGYYGDVQPRYYAVMAMPVMMVVGLGVAAVVDAGDVRAGTSGMRWAVGR